MFLGLGASVGGGAGADPVGPAAAVLLRLLVEWSASDIPDIVAAAARALAAVAGAGGSAGTLILPAPAPSPSPSPSLSNWYHVELDSSVRCAAAVSRGKR